MNPNSQQQPNNFYNPNTQYQQQATAQQGNNDQQYYSPQQAMQQQNVAQENYFGPQQTQNYQQQTQQTQQQQNYLNTTPPQHTGNMQQQQFYNPQQQNYQTTTTPQMQQQQQQNNPPQQQQFFVPPTQQQTNQNQNQQPQQQQQQHMQQQQGQQVHQPQMQPQQAGEELYPSPATLGQQVPMNVKFLTGQATQPVSSTLEFSCVDSGSASLKMVRPTMQRLPETTKVAQQTGIPLGCIVQPYKQPDVIDYPSAVPVVKFDQADAPLRCTRCGSYINRYVKFLSNDRYWECNLCGNSNDVPRWYQGNLSMNVVQQNATARPELKWGTVDYHVGETNHAPNRKPQPLHYVYIVECTRHMTSQGIFMSVLAALRNLLMQKKLQQASYRNCRIAIMTVGQTIHFYNAKTQPNIMNFVEVNEPLKALPTPADSLFYTIEELMGISNLATPEDVEEIQENELTESLFKLMETNAQYESSNNKSCLGAALQAAELLLNGRGGKVNIFASQIPSHGQGKLEKPRLDRTEQDEGELFIGQLGFWRERANVCANAGIGVNFYLFSSQNFTESSTMGIVSRTTGGRINVYHNFIQGRDYPRMKFDVVEDFLKDTAYDCVIRVRSSVGIAVKSYYGNFYQQKNAGHISIANVDCDYTIAVSLEQETKLTSNSYIQSAMLYTSRTGQRMIRIHTTRLGVVSEPADCFRYADLDAVLRYQCAIYANDALTFKNNLATLRENMTYLAIEIFSKYRLHSKKSVNQTPPGQMEPLFLPESLKLLPLYFLGLSKSDGFCTSNNVTLDERFVHLTHLLSMSCRNTLLYLYPRMFGLHLLQDIPDLTTGQLDKSTVMLPQTMRLSARYFRSNGIYLLDNGVRTFMFLGSEASDDLVSQLYGVASLAELPESPKLKPDTTTVFGAYVQHILDTLNKDRIFSGPLITMKSMHTSTFQQFMRHIMEDRTGSLSYDDHLQNLRREINLIIKK